MPEDRLLDYPFVRIEGVQDDFETTQNRDQIARTEDLHFGMQYALELGYSTPALGADRERALVHAEASRGWRLGEDNSMFADAAIDTAAWRAERPRTRCCRPACATTIPRDPTASSSRDCGAAAAGISMPITS